MTRRGQVRFDRSTGVTCLILVGLVGGCLGRSPDPRLFTLGSEPRSTTASFDTDLAVLVGPARFPRHLERPQLTRRLEGGEISIDEFNRWAGGFEENVLRSLAEDLAMRLSSERVVSFPSSPPFELDYRIRLHFDEFVVGPDEMLHLRVRWGLVGVGEPDRVSIGRTDLDLPLAGEGMLSIVAAHDEAIRALGAAVAEQVSTLEAAADPPPALSLGLAPFDAAPTPLPTPPAAAEDGT